MLCPILYLMQTSRHAYSYSISTTTALGRGGKGGLVNIPVVVVRDGGLKGEVCIPLTGAKWVGCSVAPRGCVWGVCALSS